MNYLTVLQGELQDMARAAIALLPNLAIASVVLIVAWLVAKGATNIARRITGHTHLRNDLRELLQSLVKVAIWLIGFLLAATIAIPGFTFGGMVAGLGIGALAIGFAFQDIFQNFLAGVLIMLREKMQIGDTIETEGIEGTVERITLRETHVRQFSGELTILPNAMIFKNAVKIFSDPGLRRFQIIVGVDYDSDLAQSRQAITDALASVDGIDHPKGTDVFAREFGDSAINFLVRWWVDTRNHNLFTVQNDVVLAIKMALDDAGIEFPFPYVTNTFAEPLALDIRRPKSETQGAEAAA